MFKPYQITHIRYTSKDGNDVTNRAVIPTFVPSPHMKAIDVTNLSVEEREHLQAMLHEYATYFESAVKRIFSFEDWISHTTGLSEEEIPEVKWRTFLLENTEKVG